MEIRKNKSRKEIQELYERAEQIKPLAEKDGQVWVTFEDAAILNSINAEEPRTGMQTRNPDGSIASTGKTVHAINPDYFFENRCKKEKKKLYVVSGHEPNGFRCIQEQSSGHTFIKTIPVYVIARNADGDLFVESLTNTDERTFIAEYTSRLNNALMAEILPLITSYGAKQTEFDSMPI